MSARVNPLRLCGTFTERQSSAVAGTPSQTRVRAGADLCCVTHCCTFERKTAVLLEALADVERSSYERRWLRWVAAWETHVVATLAALLRHSYAAGAEAARDQTCNDADREQAS